MKKITCLVLAAFCAGAASASIVWSEDFSGTTNGATSGNNQTLYNTVIQTANTASSIVVDSTTDPTAAAAFTLADGQFIRLSTGENGYTAIRPSTNPVDFAQVPSTYYYTMSFDIYIPVTLDKAVGDWQPRFKLSGVGGNGSTDASQVVAEAGQYHIVYQGQISDFIATDVDEARPFIGIDQDEVAVADYMYMDNIELDISPIPEPATLSLFGMVGGALWFIKRRRA